MDYQNRYFEIEATATDFSIRRGGLDAAGVPEDDDRRRQLGKEFDEFEANASDELRPEDYEEIFGQSPPDPHRPAGLRIELDEDDQADESDRILHRFPVFVRHLLARQIALACFKDHLTIADLDGFTDDELATKAFCYLPLRVDSDASADRRRSYVRILGTALRHFQDDPAAVRASIEVVHMIANPRPRQTAPTPAGELDG